MLHTDIGVIAPVFTLLPVEHMPSAKSQPWGPPLPTIFSPQSYCLRTHLPYPYWTVNKSVLSFTEGSREHVMQMKECHQQILAA